MTRHDDPEQAIGELSDIFENVLEFRDNRTISAFNTAFRALKLRVKMLPESQGKDYYRRIGKCPMCKAYVDDDYKFCKKCGQAMDWGK